MIIFQPVSSTPAEFVAFWSARYLYSDQKHYEENIGKPLTEARTLELFEWKNGTPLSASKRASVIRNFASRIPELDDIPPTTEARVFLDRFNSSGAIWRIFWLHCWQPRRFPIYDQHVHRAMRFLQAGVRQEIPDSDKARIESYLTCYLPFHSEFPSFDGRLVDKALWAFGKFLSENNFPMTPPS